MDNESGWSAGTAVDFCQQLERNNQELNSGNYPVHWMHFLKHIEFLLRDVRPNKFKTILDLGCGVGVYYKLIHKHFPELGYSGIDYSRAAISIARATWNAPPDTFFWKPFEELIKVNDCVIVVANALCDVMPDGDACLKSILKLKPEALLLQRVRTTGGNSYAEQYRAYTNINTNAFYHNAHNLLFNILDGYEVDYDRFDNEGTLDIVAYK